MRRFFLIDDSELLSHLYEGGDGLVEVFARVGSGELNPDSVLALGNHWVGE